MLRLNRLRFYRRFYHRLWFRLRLRFDDGVLTLSRTRRCRRLTFGRLARRRGATGAITDRRDGCRFSWQRRVSYGAVQLALLLGQRIIQIALNFNALLALRLCRGLALGRVRGNRRYRDVLLCGGIGGSLILAGSWRAGGLVVRQINALLAGSGLLAGRRWRFQRGTDTHD